MYNKVLNCARDGTSENFFISGKFVETIRFSAFAGVNCHFKTIASASQLK